MKTSDMGPGSSPHHHATRPLTDGSLVFLCPRDLPRLRRLKNSFDSSEKMKMSIPSLYLKQIYYLPGYVAETRFVNILIQQILLTAVISTCL